MPLIILDETFLAKYFDSILIAKVHRVQ